MSDDKTPFEKFENLAKRLFSIVKKDVKKAVDEVGEDIVERTAPEWINPDEDE